MPRCEPDATLSMNEASRNEEMPLLTSEASAERTEPFVAARTREIHARQALALAIVRAEATYVCAARQLSELDELLAAVRLRLRAGGYLVPTTAPDHRPLEERSQLDATDQGRSSRLPGEPANRGHRRLAHA
jgi:hypothetical protein